MSTSVKETVDNTREKTLGKKGYREAAMLFSCTERNVREVKIVTSNIYSKIIYYIQVFPIISISFLKLISIIHGAKSNPNSVELD